MYSNRDVIWNRTKYGVLVILLNSDIVTTALWLLFLWTIRFRLSDQVTQAARVVASWRVKPSYLSVEKISYPYRDELGELVTAFNDSRTQLHATVLELDNLNHNLEATVQEVHPIGPLVRVELAHASELIEVELTRERATVLALAEGQQVWLKPRQVRVFAAPSAAMEEGGSGI